MGIESISPIGSGIYNPYSMYGMYGMGMYGMMPPQNLQQYKNRQSVMTDLRTNQVSFMGKINPLFGTQREERVGFLKSLGDFNASFGKTLSPYSNENIANTRQTMDAVSQMQMQMMANPWALSGMGIMC